jgi:hypothetical protein
MTVSSLITGSLAFILEVILLIVALTIVRKRRAEAGALIAASAGLQMFLTLLTPIAYSVMGRLTSGSSYLEMSVVLQIGFAVFRSIGAVLLILGIVRLADPKDSRSSY